MTTVATSVADLAQKVKAAAPHVAALSTGEKNQALRLVAQELVAATEEILLANAEDIARVEAEGVAATVIDRLRLTPEKIAAMAQGLEQVADLADPVGEITAQWTRPNGLSFTKIRVPLGVVGVIYENRPNVTSDAFGLCFKAGNAAFLRGSSGAFASNMALAKVIRRGLQQAGITPDAMVLVEETSREAAVTFMQQRGTIDCLIPRGGPSLIQSILDHATVPYVIDGDGNCHIYVDQDADLAMATKILVNAKMQRPSVCNAAESLVVHQKVAEQFLPLVVDALNGVTLVGDAAAQRISPSIGPAAEEDFGKEFLDLKISIKIVDELSAAIAHINTYGTGHSEAIITADQTAADRFTQEIDAAAVVVNASTRFVDGEEFGFGAEIGISTQKLHARGPMGLPQLTTEKYIIHGTGQTRS